MKVIEKMLEHMDWANKQVLHYLMKNDVTEPEILKIFAHILLAEKVWITRLQRKDSNQLAIWSDLDLSSCSSLLEENKRSYRYFLSFFSDSDLDQNISYKNSKGEKYNSSIREILTHVALHGQYHRGQINKMLRQYQLEPLSLDYIFYSRSK